MAETVDFTQRLQNKVDTVKTLGLINQAHNLMPPQQKPDEDIGQIAIVKALEVTPRLMLLFLEIRGMEYDKDIKKIIKVADPIMNINGAYRLVKTLKHVAEETEWSNFNEEELNPRIFQHYVQIYPYFTFWHEQYDLDPSDFFYLSEVIMTFIDSAFHKAKGGKYVNVLGKTYSEDFLGRVMQIPNQKEVGEGFLNKLNPFRKRK
jgi:hypothetical protein